MASEGISIFFTEKKFENAILRHGQYSRIYSSVPCFCADTSSPDPNCKVCLGRSHIFYPIKENRKIEEVFSYGGSIISVTGSIKSINSVYTSTGSTYTVSTFSGSDILLTEDLKKGQYIWVDYVEQKEFEYSGVCSYTGNSLVSVPITPIVTLQGNFTGEISEVISLTNSTTGKTLEVISFWDNLILFNGVVNDNDVLAVICKYVNPIIMLILFSEPKVSKENHGPYQNADGSMTFPGIMEIGKGDIITPLIATSKTSFVGIHLGEGTYQTSFFKVSSIIKIIDRIGIINDAIILRNSEIYFPTRKPIGKFSCSLNYNVTYIVDDVPKIRHAENKILPKKVPLKRYARTSKAEKRPNTTNKFERV